MRDGRILLGVLAGLTAIAVSAGPAHPAPTVGATAIEPAAALTGSTVAVIGDYGVNTTAEANVATLVAGWSPAAVVTVGDNYYLSGGTATGTDRYDLVVGRYYCAFLQGAASGPWCAGGTATANRFFPATGNHDYSDGGISNYTSYFALPGNERYYRQVVGDVEFFFIDSDLSLVSATEMNAEKAWLEAALGDSTTAWQVVVFHHPAYSSSTHGPSTGMRWSFASWGADLILSGHDHTYERLSAGGLTYIVNGLGGAPTYSFRTTPLAESLVRYNGNWGAMRIVSAPTYLTATFVSVDGTVRDTFSLGTPPPAAPGAFGKTSPATNAKNVSRAPTLSWAAAADATGYTYCIDTTVNGACDTSWISTGTSTTVPLSGLLSKRNYEWQVRATNTGGTTDANASRWWKFTTTR